MDCPRCRLHGNRIVMKPIKRKGGFHKQTKYQCPQCSFIRMKKNK